MRHKLRVINENLDSDKTSNKILKGGDVWIFYSQLNSKLMDPLADEYDRTLNDANNKIAIHQWKLIWKLIAGGYGEDFIMKEMSDIYGASTIKKDPFMV